jgi:hypothetical protein
MEAKARSRNASSPALMVAEVTHRAQQESGTRPHPLRRIEDFPD